MASCPELKLIGGFYAEQESARIFRHFVREHRWPSNQYQVGGRQFVLPRLQTWHADQGIRYSYSNNLLETRHWTALLLGIRTRIEVYLQHSFNSVLVNYYRHGDDYVGWHADNEAELGEQPLIASLSFGAERPFCFRHKHSGDGGDIVLSSGTLMIMQPGFQHHWLHSVPKLKQLEQGRINLTFRTVIKPAQA